ncbi:unnamed protein product [Closterium sp. NIES-53]
MQTSQKQYADRQRRDHSVAVGDQVLLDTRNLNLSHLPSKLRPRFCGPFLVEAQVTPVTFRLRLPDTWKLHNAFHVQVLKPYKDPNQQFQGRQLSPPPPVLVQDEPEYEVERVLTHRRRGGKTLEFLLRWKGYDPTEDSWVVEADMGNARRALKDYLVKQVPIPPMDDVKLRGEFRAAHLLTFMFISRCCSPVVQLALKSCRERQDAGHHAWHFILSTYQVRDDLYIEQLEEKMTHIRMGEESVSDYCNRARRRMRMAGAEYSTASYISQIVKGLPHGYNLMKRVMMVPGMRGGGSGGGRSTNDVDKKRSTRDKGRGGGDRRQDCWICGDPDHLSYECLDRDDNDEDDSKGGRGRSTSRRPRRDAKPRKEKHTSKKTSSTKDVDNSSGKGRGDGEASCSMVGVVEPTVSLALEAGEDFQAMAAAVQASPMAVLLESGCSYHLMGKKVVFVDMVPSDGVKHVRGFNGALQPVKGRGTIALQGKAGKRVLIPDVRYVPGV